MKLIGLLLALFFVGFIVKNQLDSSSSNAEYEDVISNENLNVPKVPTAPEDVEKFEKDINEFMKDSADQTKKVLEESLNN